MFIYEKSGKLNVMIASNKPATGDTDPDIIIEPIAGDPIEVKITVNGEEYLTSIPAATADTFGGIKADAATEGDTVPAKIDAEGNLYVPTYPEIPVAENQADSEATTAEVLVTDFNALLAKLKAAGLMTADEQE